MIDSYINAHTLSLYVYMLWRPFADPPPAHPNTHTYTYTHTYTQEGAPLNTEGIPAGTVLKDLEARVFNQMGEEVGNVKRGVMIYNYTYITYHICVCTCIHIHTHTKQTKPHPNPKVALDAGAVKGKGHGLRPSWGSKAELSKAAFPKCVDYIYMCVCVLCRYV